MKTWVIAGSDSSSLPPFLADSVNEETSEHPKNNNQ